MLWAQIVLLVFAIYMFFAALFEDDLGDRVCAVLTVIGLTCLAALAGAFSRIIG